MCWPALGNDDAGRGRALKHRHIEAERMNTLFRDLYATTYDSIYATKDYVREVDAVMQILSKFAKARTVSILDVGCGTGRHAALLAQRNFEVTGVDRSKEMLARGRQRSEEEHLQGKLTFCQGDARNLELGGTFDAALMMFNVLGYMTTNDDLMATLRSVRRHLSEDGLFIFDIWYGPALVSDPPGERRQEVQLGTVKIVRVASGQVRGHEQRCDISINLQQLDGERVIESSEEFHQVRYFFPLEIDLALRAADFRLLAIRRFPEIDKDPELGTWGAVVVAAAGNSLNRSS
jgi:SAM-dependent methyltransferase